VGPPATDPADVPEEELVRVAVGALAELLLDAPQARREWRPHRRLLGATVSFELAGAPVTTAAVRRALALSGHVEGGPAPRVVLLAQPFDAALTEVWSARVQDGAPARWHGFVSRCAHARALPPSADLPALAREWAARVGPGEVHVVVAPGGRPAAVQRTADVLGVRLGVRARRAPRRSGPPRWVDLSPAAVDVVRRVNAVLAVRAPADHRPAAVRRLSALLLAEGATGSFPPPLTVPARFQDWAAERAEGLTEELRTGGYAVHGDLARLVPTFTGVPTHPRREEVLGLVVAACVRQAREHPRTTKERHR
jgi:hypothetical protein